MIFSLFFEIGLLVLGVFYVGHLWFESFLNMIEISKDLEEKEKEKQEDKEREELSKHLYS